MNPLLIDSQEPIIHALKTLKWESSHKKTLSTFFPEEHRFKKAEEFWCHWMTPLWTNAQEVNKNADNKRLQSQRGIPLYENF